MVGSKSDRMTKSLPKVESKAMGVREGELLWTPSAAQVEDANLTRFAKWLRRERGLEFDSYDAMWHWSVTELEDFRHPFESRAAVQYWLCSRLLFITETAPFKTGQQKISQSTT